MYKVVFLQAAAEAVKIFHPDIKKAAKKAIQELAENPSLGKELQHEFAGFRSYRFMRYRIVYRPYTQDKNIVIYIIGHRRDIYETLGNHLLKISPPEPDQNK